MKRAHNQPEIHSNSILMFNKLNAFIHFRSLCIFFSSFIEKQLLGFPSILATTTSNSSSSKKLKCRIHVGCQPFFMSFLFMDKVFQGIAKFRALYYDELSESEFSWCPSGIQISSQLIKSQELALKIIVVYQCRTGVSS